VTAGKGLSECIVVLRAAAGRRFALGRGDQRAKRVRLVQESAPPRHSGSGARLDRSRPPFLGFLEEFQRVYSKLGTDRKPFLSAGGAHHRLYGSIPFSMEMAVGAAFVART